MLIIRVIARYFKMGTPALKLNDQEVGGIEDMFSGCPKSLNIPEKFKNIK